MTNRLDLPTRYREELEGLLREHVPEAEVWAYGSRVNGQSHEDSDLDLALRGPRLEPLDGGFHDLLEAIQQANMPIQVQAHDWARLPDSVHREIERDHVVMLSGTVTIGPVTGNVTAHVVSAKWREVAILDVASATIGGTPKRAVADYWDGGIPWATAKDVAGSGSRYINEVQESITQAGLARSAAKLMPKGTVVITARGTVEVTSIVV